MKKIFLTVAFIFFSLFNFAQAGYEIKVNLKNYKDNLAYLTYYQFDKTYIKDTCTNIQNGKIIFKGKEKLDTGIYAVVSSKKAILFNFFVDEQTQKLQFKSDASTDFAEDLVAINSAAENDFLNYIKYLGTQNLAAQEMDKNAVLKTKEDTLKLIDLHRTIDKKTTDFEKDFIAKNKSSYIGSVVNLKVDKVLENVPLASNGRPDSVFAFNYYKKHYWDDVNFKDDAVMRNPFFYSKVKKYFDQVVPMHPDSVSVAIDKILDQTVEGSLLYKILLAHFTYSNETSTIMGFDKVFVHMVDKYFKTGRASSLYNNDEIIQNIINRAEKLRPLLIGSRAPELFMIKAEDFTKIKTLGFEEAKNSEAITEIYYKNLPEITKMYVKLSDVKADYTIMVFWDVDCGHCRDEIPVLLDAYNDMKKENIDVQVYSVYMQHDGEKYLKFITDHQLPWINVYDGTHFNNTLQKYDVNSTPIIYVLDKNKIIKAKRIAADKVKSIIASLAISDK